MYFIKIKNFFQNKRGIITIISAIIFPLILIFMAIVFEISNIYLTKERLQSIMDRALLNTMTTIKFMNIEDVYKKFDAINTIWTKNLKYELEHSDFSTDMHDMHNVIYGTHMKYDVVTAGFKRLAITVRSQYQVPFKICNIHSLCPKNKYVRVFSSMEIGRDEGSYIDLMIVLDVSTSMGENFMPFPHLPCSRLEVAKKSIRKMLADLRNVPNYANVFRTGSVGFNLTAQFEMPLERGIKRIYDGIKQYQPYGGTNSFAGMKYANEQLYGNTQDTKDRKKVVIFLTDGQNSFYDYTTATIALCNDMKKKKAVIYSIALAIAPSDVLKGCSSSGNVYVANDVDDLFQAYSLIGKDIMKLGLRYVR